MGFSENKKPIRGLFSPVWVFSMSRYNRVGGLLVGLPKQNGRLSSRILIGVFTCGSNCNYHCYRSRSTVGLTAGVTVARVRVHVGCVVCGEASREGRR